jgi:N-acetylglucosamine-6-sulfatase
MKRVSGILFSISLMAMATSTSYGQCVPSKPKGLYTDNKTTCSITLHWSAIPNIAYYKVQYKKTTSSTWIKVSSQLTTPEYTFNNLEANTAYNLAVISYCSSSSKSKTAKIISSTVSCMIPKAMVPALDSVNNIHISWSNPCAFSSNKIRYRKKTTAVWSNLSTGSSSTAILTGLDSNVVYLYQVLSCSDTLAWSAIDSFQISSRPNIIVIMLDDARYDSYSCNGAPTWFQTPGIDRIANEGANFKNNYTVYSSCGPSRATFYTGLYPHSNGAFSNSHEYYPALPTTGTILNNAGYYTCMIGKFLKEELDNTPKPGWDFWMAKNGNGFNINGTQTNTYDNQLNFMTDTFYHVFARKVNRDPLFMVLAYTVPHEPSDPLPQDSGIFAQEEMPFPQSFVKPYPPAPSFYSGPDYEYGDSSVCYSDIEGYYEELIGADRTIAEILDSILGYAPAENFMIIFTSDNGKMIGEHQLKGKEFPYNESMRVPLFIRYPKWFPAGTVISNENALNLDLAPSILAAAGIANTFGMQGLSLNDLYLQTQHRNCFYFEGIEVPLAASDFRTVRSAEYCYTKYQCNTVVEQFFDLTNDPLELNNQIYNSSYLSTINAYRSKLDSFALVLNDTIVLAEGTCYEILSEKIGAQQINSVQANLDFSVSPNPFTNTTTISFTINSSNESAINSFVKLELFSVAGRKIATLLEGNISSGEHRIELNRNQLPAGIYLLQLRVNGEVVVRKVVME